MMDYEITTTTKSNVKSVTANGDDEVRRGLVGTYVDYTRICEIDDHNDKLRYRGYDLADLCARVTFEHVVHLLLQGELPNGSDAEATRRQLERNRHLAPNVVEVIDSFPVTAAPMVVLRTAISALGGDAFARSADVAQTRDAALCLIAQVPLIVGRFEARRRGALPLEPVPGAGQAFHVLQQLTNREPDPLDVAVMDQALTIHAEHELNASCFAARVAASTLTDLATAITAAVGTLSGALHGGANERVLEIVDAIGDADGVDDYVDDALSRKQKIPGFGQRGCRAEDPRAILLRAMAAELATRTGDDRVFRTLCRLDASVRARTELWPNVDFYSAAVFHSLGIPKDLFTPLFACSRVSGWSAHVVEQLADNRLIRPKAKYIGPVLRPVC